MLGIGDGRQAKAAAHRCGRLLQLDPGARVRTTVQLLPHQGALETDVGELALVHRLVVAREPFVTLREAPALIQLGLVDQDVCATEHVTKLRQIEAVALEVRDDRGLGGREPLDSYAQARAELPYSRCDLHHQTHARAHALGLLLTGGLWLSSGVRFPYRPGG